MQGQTLVFDWQLNLLWINQKIEKWCNTCFMPYVMLQYIMGASHRNTFIFCHNIMRDDVMRRYLSSLNIPFQDRKYLRYGQWNENHSLFCSWNIKTAFFRQHTCICYIYDVHIRISFSLLLIVQRTERWYLIVFHSRVWCLFVL
jgi:hypothetical protein